MILGTAGHIDHGKSALVSALTGKPMDRLSEERRRGITIELNFAPLELEGLPPIGVVDVPGHEDFVRTMVAGATGVDLVLLVVDAVEGIRPQTLEHLAIVEQLGIPHGIPALTKIDLAEPDWVDLVEADLAERLAGSPVRFEYPARVSAVTGAGLDSLRERIRAVAVGLAARPAGDVFRLPIDRSFAVPGVGPVVTGTLWSGSVRVGDQVRIEPGGLTARVRSVESFGRQVDAAVPGTRTAVGLSGVDLSAIHRGQVLVQAARAWSPTTVFDAVVALLPEAPRPVTTRSRLRLHHGTAEVMVRAYPRQPIQPGTEGLARLVTEAPVVVRGEDRFVLRSYSPVTTIGGGRVVDPAPPKRAGWPPALSSTRSELRLVALLERRPAGIPRDAIFRFGGELEGAPPEITEVRGTVVLARRLEEAKSALLGALARYHAAAPSAPGQSLETLRAGLGPLGWLGDYVLEQLVGEGRVKVREGVAALSDHMPASGGGDAEVEAVVARVRESGLEGATIRDLSERLLLRDLAGSLRIAVGRGEVEAVERDRYLATEVLAKVVEVLTLAGEGSAEISPGSLRDALGLSRKHIIPLLEWADRKGLTWRDHQGIRRLRGR